MLIKSHLHLIDLAGSERVKKSKAEGNRLKEAVGINSSLLVLGKVIASLVESKSHIPYLESKLTTMLRGSFGGNSRTTAIINCRSDDTHGDETLQSMRFGERCGMISNSAKMAASSISTALESIDNSLLKVQEQLLSLESRGKNHLESYFKLKKSFQQMKMKRDNLSKATAIETNNQQQLTFNNK
jgi:kinesin family protein 5